MDWSNLGDYAAYIIIGVIALISWVIKALRKSQQQQPQQRRPILQESTAETPPAEQTQTGLERIVQDLFGIEEHEEQEEYEEVVEEPEPAPVPAVVVEEKPAPPAKETAEAPTPEEMRKRLGEIMGVPLNPQNIKYGVIFSEILKRPTPRRLRD